MGYEAILVHVQTTKHARRRLDCACALAKMFDATLIGVGAEMFPLPAPDYGYFAVPTDWYGIMRKTIDGNLDRACGVFDAAAIDLVKPTIWESGLRVPMEAVAEASRGADLIVTGPPPREPGNLYYDISTGELVIRSGRPVLIAPARGADLVADKVVLVWKDTREARRALSDAMPFFKRAKAVLVLEICGKDEAADAHIRTSDVAAALARHGVQATAKVAAGHGTAREVAKQADVFGADLIVAGGYGHSRMNEWVFGGVTRDLLSLRTHYVLLSH